LRLPLNGAGDGIRTRDIQLGKLTLYQLSYTRIWQDSPFIALFGDFGKRLFFMKKFFSCPAP